MAVALRPISPPRRPAAPTWGDLVAREPRLGQLLAEIRATDATDPHFCANRAWFGPRYAGGGYKARMTALVGWFAEGDDPVLRGHEAYRVAYGRLYAALPDCRDCPCPSVAEIFAAGAG